MRKGSVECSDNRYVDLNLEPGKEMKIFEFLELDPD